MWMTRFDMLLEKTRWAESKPLYLDTLFQYLLRIRFASDRRADAAQVHTKRSRHCLLFEWRLTLSRGTPHGSQCMPWTKYCDLARRASFQSRPTTGSLIWRSNEERVSVPGNWGFVRKQRKELTRHVGQLMQTLVRSSGGFWMLVRLEVSNEFRHASQIVCAHWSIFGRCLLLSVKIWRWEKERDDETDRTTQNTRNTTESAGSYDRQQSSGKNAWYGATDCESKRQEKQWRREDWRAVEGFFAPIKGM